MPEVGVNEYAAAARFRTALRRFMRESEIVSREHGVTPRQYLLLLQIAASEGGTATVTDLVDRLVLTQSTVTELVQRAEQAGLVERQTSQHDARVVHLSLSAHGEGVLRAIHSRLTGERLRLQQMLDGQD
ncbi:MAG TPA: MarR family transcriptional regulator [Gaiellaceae bacterium]|nr:MarR family transcriptional regulator [Gaiellaceae bacterium]